MTRAWRVGAALVAASLLSGCTFNGIYSLPLPGAAASHGSTYRVTVILPDALELVPYAAVKVNYATVGHVASVGLKDRHAAVVCVLPTSVHLPANAIARVDQTSLLGERFVEIEPPKGEKSTGQLRNDATIPLSRTDTTATVEEVLSSLSLLLNGGGIDQLHTIEHELNRALQGREGAARQSLEQISSFVNGLDQQKQQILDAISGLDQLAHTVRAQEGALTGAVDTMPAALNILADDTPQLTKLLTAVQHLGTVAVHVENASFDDLVANLRNLEPTLSQLAKVGSDIPKSLEIAITYPTADGVECCFFGDYGNIRVTVDLSLTSLQRNFSDLGLPLPASGPSAPKIPAATKPSTPVKPPTLRLTPMQWITGTSITDLLLGVLK